MRFVVVILVLIHDCDVCSFFALFIFPFSSSISLHYCVHFPLLARFLCYPLLFISVSLSSYFAFVLFCSVGSSRFVTQFVPAIFLYVCGTRSLDRCRNQQCDNLHCRFFSLFRCFRRWWIRCYVPGTSSFVLSFCLSSWAHSFCREGVPRRAHVRICMSRRWVFRTCSIHTLLTGSLYRTTCSSFFTLQT